MGPIETMFLVMLVFFGVFGIVRGFGRELGVTTLLLLTLFVLEFVYENAPAQQLIDKGISFFAGANIDAVITARFVFFCIVLIVVAFVSYEGETLSFPGKRGNVLFDLGTGLLNGYLFAGSLWYYLAAAGWPLIGAAAPFSRLYNFMMPLLPPAVFEWKYLMALTVVLLIARVWK